MENRQLAAKAILLDLDGTIVDSRIAYLEAVKAAFAATGQRTVDINIVTEIPKRIEQSLPIDDLLNGLNVKEFLKVYLDAYYRAAKEKTKPMPSISQTLERLSNKAKLALITMRHVPNEKVIDELERFGLARYFQMVVTALDTSRPKPSPDALIRCVTALGVQLDECVVVGDSVTDVRAGKSAGTMTVAVLSGIFSRKELATEKPDLILENVSMLPDFIK
jgi:HAD superfamily hydrolase (TIGR01509 family)